MNALDYIKDKYGVDYNQESPIHLDGESFAGFLNALGVKVGAEIGTERGGFAKVLCERIPGLKLYCIDSYAAYDKNYRRKYRQRHHNRIHAEAKKRLEEYDCTIIRGFSMDVVKQFDDESLDFVFIDANHEFQNCANDIAAWSKKVKPGGIISGHDYIRVTLREELIEVVDAVNGWTRAKNIKPWFVFNGDKGPCWLWIKS